MVVLAIFPILATAGDQEAPSIEEQMNGLQGMCDASAEARTARQEAKPLYDRLGGYERIHALTTEIVRLHQINPDFRLMMKYVDGEDLATSVADFIAAGTDVAQAMKNLGYGQEEIDEVICILVSLKDQVVLK
jgi:hypothetical protein